MKRFVLFTLAAAALSSASLQAQVVGPEFSGIHRIALPGNSDSIVCAVFARPSAAAGRALSFSSNRLTFQGTPNWTASQFVAGGTVVDTYYLRVISGAKEGALYTVTANDANSVTLDLDGDSLTGLAPGDRLSIIPYSTLGSLFPGGAGLHVSPSAGDRQTEILFPNFNATGINASANRIFYFWNGNWRETGQGLAILDNEIVHPDSYFIVRQNVATGTEWVSAGQVAAGKLTTWLGVSAGGQRDNFLGLMRPVATTLASSGLIASGAFAASPTPGNRTDELLVFDNSTPRKNRAASAIYYYWSGAWRKVGAGSTSFDTAPVFTPGAGFIIRKNAATVAPTWTNSPNY